MGLYVNPLTWPERGRLWLRIGIRLAVGALILALVWSAGDRLLSLFMPFLLAFAAATLLNPVVRRLQRGLGWSRGVLSALVLAVVFGLASWAVTLLIRAAIRELMALAENRQNILHAAEQSISRLNVLLQRMAEKLPFPLAAPGQPASQPLMDWLQEWLRQAAPDPGNLTEFAADKAKGAISFLLGLVAFLMGSYFLCSDYPYLRTRLIQRVDEGQLLFLAQIKAVALAAFGGYLKAQALLTTGVFLLLLAGFLLAGQSYALLLALGLAVLDFIPLVGAGTVMIPWAVIDLCTGHYVRSAYVMSIWGAVALFRRAAEPKFVGDQTGLSPIASLISIYAGMKLAGVTGMILGPIVTLVVLNLLGLGLLDGAKADLRLALEDTAAILQGSRNRQ